MNWLTNLLPGLACTPNIHPLVVHSPIVLLPLACFLYFLSWKNPNTWISPAAKWSLWLGTASAAVAILAGYLAANGLGHDKPGHELVHEHRNLMLATGGLALIVSILNLTLARNNNAMSRWLLAAGHVALTGLLIVGSDRGAALVYQHGFGVQQSSTTEVEYSDGHQNESDSHGEPSDVHDHNH